MIWGKLIVLRMGLAGPFQGSPPAAKWLILLLISRSILPCAAAAGKPLGQRADGSEAHDRARLLFFTAPWCAPCHRIQPHVARICQKNSAAVEMVVINYDESPLVVEEFAVESLPTMVLLDGSGKLRFRVNGASREGLNALAAEIRRLPKRKK